MLGYEHMLQHVVSMCYGVCNMFACNMKQQQMKMEVDPGLAGVLFLYLMVPERTEVTLEWGS